VTPGSLWLYSGHFASGLDDDGDEDEVTVSNPILWESDHEKRIQDIRFHAQMHTIARPAIINAKLRNSH